MGLCSTMHNDHNTIQAQSLNETSGTFPMIYLFHLKLSRLNK